MPPQFTLWRRREALHPLLFLSVTQILVEGLFLLLLPHLRGMRSILEVTGPNSWLWLLPPPFGGFHARTGMRERRSRWIAAIWRLLLHPVPLGCTRLKRLLVHLLSATVGYSLTPKLLLRRLQILPVALLRMQHAAPAAPLTSPLRVHDPSTIESLHNSTKHHL